jgi:hypothetical protein
MPDPELLEAASAGEADSRFWAVEFAWLLRHPAIGPVIERNGEDESLTLATIAGQHAARFPLVSGDADWLRHRSVAVVARRLAPHLAGGSHVGLDLSQIARGEAAGAIGREQMRLVTAGLDAELSSSLARYGVVPSRLTLSTGADHPGLGNLLRLRQSSALGQPRIAIRVPDRLMHALLGQEKGDPSDWPVEPLRLWHGLTDLAHREPGVRLILQHTTRPACTLAGGERGDAVLPVSLFEVRADTAWLAVRIRLEALILESPRAALKEMRRLLRAVVRLADNLVEQLDWASPELAQDALVNRRLAVHVTGIGDLVDRWKMDPAAIPSVGLAGRWVGVFRRLMMRESNALARERGPFPGLELRDIASSLARTVGDERARRLLRQAGLRHRHLLVLSPYSVFPGVAPRLPLSAYLHLLPVIRWADTIAMHGDGVAPSLPLSAMRRLIRMTWAIARNRP